MLTRAWFWKTAVRKGQIAQKINNWITVASLPFANVQH
jgi:hypothetical protein